MTVMTAADVQRLAGRGEGQTLEFKRRAPEPARLAKELIAFANTDGGRLLIGVDDDGTVTGVKDAEEEEYALRNALAMYCVPALNWRSERVQITRKRDVIVVAVSRSRDRPHFLVEPENGARRAAYVRVEDRSVEASEAAVALMRDERFQEDTQFEFGELELQLMRYLESYGRITIDAFSRMADVAEERASTILVTLTRARVLSHHLDYDGDYFTMRYAE
jgi:predicted HTH transcriptional regulator